MIAPPTPSAEARAAGLAELVDRLSARLQAGEPLDAEQVLREFPEYANELRGLLPTIAWHSPHNLIHILFDNECYEASGGTETATSAVADPVALAKGAGYKNALWVKSPNDLHREFLRAWKRNQLCLLAVKVKPGGPKLASNLYDEVENKYRFIRYLEETEKKGIIGSADHVVKATKQKKN